MRIGLFGGTFDPIHLGHLIVAEACREQAQLDAVWFIPAARPPHKLEQPITPYDRRADMVALAITGQPLFELNRIEKDRPGPSFTVHTLRELREQHPAHHYFLILGADSLPDFQQWREPIELIQRAELLVVARPGSELMSAESLAASVQLSDVSALRMTIIDSPLIEVASRVIRDKVARGKTIRYLTPRAVEEYIRERRLYANPELD